MLTYFRPAQRLASLLIIFCSSTFASNPPQSAESKPATSADYSQQPVVIETLASIIHFQADGTSTRDVHTRIRVQTDAAVKQLGQLVLGYNSESEHISVTGRVIKPDHSEVAITQSAIQDLSSPVSRVAPMYTDTRQKHVTVPSLRPGDILEYDLRIEQYVPLAPNQFWTSYNFNKKSIVLSEELTIDVPSSKYTNVKTRDDLPKPEVKKSNGREVYKWTHSNLRPDDDSQTAKDNKKKKKQDDEVAAVRVTTFKAWGEIARWYAGLESDRRAPNDAIRAKVNELTKGLSTDRDKLEALYDYVAKNYRYVSLSFGTGRYQPHAAADIFANEYGDCKDKNTLLAAMAEAAGMHVDSVLISSGTKVDPEFPSPAQFDHVISYVPLANEVVWLDTTTEIAPFRMLVHNLRKKQALVVTNDGRAGLRETPADPSVPNMEGVEVIGSINDLGTLSADIRLTFRGDAEVFGRATVRQIPTARWNEFAKYLAKFAKLDGDVSDVHLSDPADTRHPLEYRFHVVKPNYYNRFEKNARLLLPVATIRLPDAEDAEENKAFDLPKNHFEYKLKLELPKTFGVQLPLGVDQKRDYATYVSQYALDGVTLTAVRTLDSKVNELPYDRLNDFLAFRRVVVADENQQVAVHVGETSKEEVLGGATTEELMQSANAAYNSGNFQAAIELFHQVIKKEPDHKSAYNDLGLAYLALHQLDKAQQVLEKAIELNPFGPYAHNNLGRVYWQQRRYDLAEKSFLKQIEISPLDKWAHRNLGLMLLEQKKYAQSEPELEKAVSISRNDPFTLVELGSAQINNGKPEKAQKAFDKAAELAPTNPGIWNNIAYQLAEHKLNLDRARRYAEQSVTMTATQLRNVRLDSLSLQTVGLVQSLGLYWDTLGWVQFQQGNLDQAEKYLQAAWNLGQHAASADHLGQLYEKKGDKARAIEMYARAQASPYPDADSRAHLVALVGESKADSAIDAQRGKLSEQRSYVIPEIKGDGAADFFVLLAPGSKTEDIRFVSGSEKLKSFADSLRSYNFKPQFPDDAETRIIRRGTLSCSGTPGPQVMHQAAKKEKSEPAGITPPEKPAAGGPCTFVLTTPDLVRSIN